MKRVLAQAFIIALPYSVFVSIVFYTFSIDFYAVMPVDEPEKVYLGFEAVQYMIKENGIFEYLRNAVPHYIFFGVTVFLALVIQGAINAKQQNE